MAYSLPSLILLLFRPIIFRYAGHYDDELPGRRRLTSFPGRYDAEYVREILAKILGILVAAIPFVS